MKERSELITCIRGEIVGPSIPLVTPTIAIFEGQVFLDAVPFRRGPLGWKPDSTSEIEEVLYYEREKPSNKYGAGLLHPAGLPITEQDSPSLIAVKETDRIGFDRDESEADSKSGEDNEVTENFVQDLDRYETDDEFEVTSTDVRHPSTIGVTFCVSLERDGRIIIRLPQKMLFAWQAADALPFQVNGRYESSLRYTIDDHGQQREAPVWRRRPALLPDTEISIDFGDLDNGRSLVREVLLPEDSPMNLQIRAYARSREINGLWIITVVLCNITQAATNLASQESTLFQTYFEITIEGGRLEKYPESPQPFSNLDSEEQSLALLYRESATWGIGHGCAAGWDAAPGQTPEKIYADVMPAVELPSMTPDIRDKQGNPIKLSMRMLAELSDNKIGAGWTSLAELSEEYRKWIVLKRKEVNELPLHLQSVAESHIVACEKCLKRINSGITALHNDPQVLKAFRLANLSMLLQQITTKQLIRRNLHWDNKKERVLPSGDYKAPWDIYSQSHEREDIGQWRAFQVAFLLLSIDGVGNISSPDREIVDLIWFPTGGGKTEAYLAVMAFYMVHQRLLMQNDVIDLHRDGTNVLMRYTLRMLTTQQFQRAASLVCALEFLRRNPDNDIPGRRFSLGLWIGGDSTPNKIENAKLEFARFQRGDISGNPLVLTECPWCRAEIGRFEGTLPAHSSRKRFKPVKGISDQGQDGPLLHCSDSNCEFGKENQTTWIPVEVVDERIYRFPPSVIIATADKFAMMAYRPISGAIFGRNKVGTEIQQTHVPPGLIIQDELHLISGPLGTMYALYEGIFERLCSLKVNALWLKPKLIASTATIRGAADQVKALYGREQLHLFPSPGLVMGDSFFGKYARDEDGRLLPGRLYLGIHANDYSSILTTQVRAFSAALFRPYTFNPEVRDPWWTLLAFFNSIRELSGAKTLFDSDITERLKFLFSRENFPLDKRRFLKPAEELTSRLSQAEIVAMMDRLSAEYKTDSGNTIDACLASSIIEVGVDIERLSLMGVIGQPKTTAQYIQVTGRVGRRWWDRAGLIMMIYNPSKSRDRSHFEQFHSYHRRLYERVEPTSATPFALSAIQRALPGALILWSRLHCSAEVQNFNAYEKGLDYAVELLQERCKIVQTNAMDQNRSSQELKRICQDLKVKWKQNPQQWEEFPPNDQGEYLMLWPGQYATLTQKQHGAVVANNMRQVDGSAELNITQGYVSFGQVDQPIQWRQD